MYLHFLSTLRWHRQINVSSRKIRTHSSYVSNSILLLMSWRCPRARASAVVVMLSHNLLVSVPEYIMVIRSFFQVGNGYRLQRFLTEWCEFWHAYSRIRADSRFAPSQWETTLLYNVVRLAGRKPRISPENLKITKALWNMYAAMNWVGICYRLCFGLSPVMCQAIIWNNFNCQKLHLEMSSAKSRPFYLGCHVLTWMRPLRRTQRTHSTHK